MCKAMAFELGRVPFHVPGCDVLSGRKTKSVGQSVRVDPSSQVRKFDVNKTAMDCANTILMEQKINTRAELSTLLRELKYTPEELIASCARLLDIINEVPDDLGTAFIIVIQLLIGDENGDRKGDEFLRRVRRKVPAAKDTKVAKEVIGSITRETFYFK